jgi:hypothetical protein
MTRYLIIASYKDRPTVCLEQKGRFANDAIQRAMQRLFGNPFRIEARAL